MSTSRWWLLLPLLMKSIMTTAESTGKHMSYIECVHKQIKIPTGDDALIDPAFDG